MFPYNNNKDHEAGHLDATNLTLDSLARLTLRWGHLDARYVL